MKNTNSRFAPPWRRLQRFIRLVDADPPGRRCHDNTKENA
jgi:hypothetical protein